MRENGDKQDRETGSKSMRQEELCYPHSNIESSTTTQIDSRKNTSSNRIRSIAMVKDLHRFQHSTKNGSYQRFRELFLQIDE